MVDLKKDIKFVKGVGPNRATLLNKLGINTLEDLITYYPRDYENRSMHKKIAECIDGEETLIEAMVTSRMVEVRTSKKNMTMYKLIVRDDTGSMLLMWYNQSYLKNKFKPGEIYKFFGKIQNKFGTPQMVSPVFDLEGKNKNTGKIIPIYPSTYGMSQNLLRQIIENGLSEIENKLEETIPEYILEQYNLQEINLATKMIHFPKEISDFEKARERFAFEELLSMQLGLLSLKNKYEKQDEGIMFSKKVKMIDVINSLPFNLTNAQTKVLKEINNDMESSKSMNRLLQGDVGSRKNDCSDCRSIQGSNVWISGNNNGAYSYTCKSAFRRI